MGLDWIGFSRRILKWWILKNGCSNNWFSRWTLKLGSQRFDSQGGFSRGILQGDSQGGFSRGILKNLIFGHPSLGNPGFEVLEILVLIRYQQNRVLGVKKSWIWASKKDAERNYEPDGPILSPWALFWGPFMQKVLICKKRIFPLSAPAQTLAILCPILWGSLLNVFWHFQAGLRKTRLSGS